MPQIVKVNVSTLSAPAPITLQSVGAFISQGATTLTDGVPQILTQASDLTQYLASPLGLASITQTGGVATATATSAHHVPSGQTFVVSIYNATPTAYNGTFRATSTGTTTFTYAVPSGTASPATGGAIAYSPGNQGELVNRVGDFFAQGQSQSVYVIEFGAGTPAAGVIALQAYIAAPYTVPATGIPIQVYNWGLPGTWTTESTAPPLVAANNTDGSLVNFLVPVSLTGSTYTGWQLTPPLKAALTMTQAAASPVSESDIGAVMYKMLQKSPPSATSRLTPLSVNFLQDVTPYGPTPTQAVTLQGANVNYVGTGFEGGISAAVLVNGTMMDGNDFQFWFAVDWGNLNLNQAISNAIINGNNNPTNPVLYNQAGINTLKAVAQGVINNGITFGIFNGDAIPAPIVTAIPFAIYTAQNPSHYALGIYNGLAVTVTPLNGFKSITFNLQISNFGVSGGAGS